MSGPQKAHHVHVLLTQRFASMATMGVPRYFAVDMSRCPDFPTCIERWAAQLSSCLRAVSLSRCTPTFAPSRSSHELTLPAQKRASQGAKKTCDHS
jgi:hypothetical protein